MLIFLNDNIFQISLKTKQIITNYIIAPLLKNKLFSENRLNKFKVLSTHNYNEKTKKYEEIILLKEFFGNKVYVYYWDDKTLLEKKEFKLSFFTDLIEFNVYENNKNNQHSLDTEKL